MQIPSAIIFINNDLAPPIKNNISQPPFLGEAHNIGVQLQIDEIMSSDEFNARVSADPNYPVFVHLNNLRILVILSNFQDQTNRALADIVLFASHGQVAVLHNNVGPPTLSLPTERLNIFNLYADIKNIYHFDFSCRKHKCGCCCNCFKHLSYCLQNMLLTPWDLSGTHSANCDSEYNNKDWLNRK